MSAEPQFPGRSPEKKSRHLSVVRSENGEQQNKRALVPEASPRTSRRLMITVFSMIPLVLLLILLINIMTASRQYDLVELRTQEETLTQENEALAQEIEYYQAPQDLAVRASQLGLIATDVQASIDLQTGKVTGVPLAATKSEDQPKNLIDPPSLNDTEASATASERAEEQKKKEEAEQKKKAEAEASASASPSAAAQPGASGSSQPEPAPSAEQPTAGTANNSSQNNN